MGVDRDEATLAALLASAVRRPQGRILTAAAATLALAAAPAGAAAQEGDDEPRPLVGDRPDFTESAVTVAPARLQLEAGYTYTRSGGTRVHDVGEGLVRVGVAPGAELRVGVESFSVVDPSGSGSVSGLRDPSLGAKLALPEPPGGAVPKAALLVGTTLPVGSDGLGAEGLRPGATLAVGWDAAGGLGIGANAGYTWEKDGGRRVHEVSASGAVSWQLTPSAGLFAEYFGLYRDVREDENFLSGGATWGLGPDLQLDARVGLGLDGPEPDHFAGVGVVLRR